MAQVIDDRQKDWFRFVMETIEKASGDRKKVEELISTEMEGQLDAARTPDGN